MTHPDPNEIDVFIQVAAGMLRQVMADGGRKRAAGVKPPWWRDGGHVVAIFSHLYKYMRGDRVDKQSGANPLVHLGCRALMQAYQDTYGQVDPQEGH